MCIFRVCLESFPSHPLYHWQSGPRHHLPAWMVAMVFRPALLFWSCPLHDVLSSQLSEGCFYNRSGIIPLPPKLPVGPFQGTSHCNSSPLSSSPTASALWSLCSSQTGLLPLSPMCQASSRLRFCTGHSSFCLKHSFPRCPHASFSSPSTLWLKWHLLYDACSGGLIKNFNPFHHSPSLLLGSLFYTALNTPSNVVNNLLSYYFKKSISFL